MKKFTFLLLSFFSFSVSTMCLAGKNGQLYEKYQDELYAKIKPYLTFNQLNENKDLIQLFQSVETLSSLDKKERSKVIQDFKEWIPPEIFWEVKAEPAFESQNLNRLFKHYKPPEGSAKWIIPINSLCMLSFECSNEEHGIALLRFSARLGHARAAFALSEAANYENEESRKNWLFKSAAQGFDEALYKLCIHYTLFPWDFKLEKNDDLSKELCKAAADKGHPKAIFYYNVAPYSEGAWGESLDFKRAVNSAQELAEKGNPDAMNYLKGILYTDTEDLKETNNLSDEDLKILKKNFNWSEDFVQQRRAVSSFIEGISNAGSIDKIGAYLTNLSRMPSYIQEDSKEKTLKVSLVDYANAQFINNQDNAEFLVNILEINLLQAKYYKEYQPGKSYYHAVRADEYFEQLEKSYSHTEAYKKAQELKKQIYLEAKDANLLRSTPAYESMEIEPSVSNEDLDKAKFQELFTASSSQFVGKDTIETPMHKRSRKSYHITIEGTATTSHNLIEIDFDNSLVIAGKKFNKGNTRSVSQKKLFNEILQIHKNFQTYPQKETHFRFLNISTKKQLGIIEESILPFLTNDSPDFLIEKYTCGKDSSDDLKQKTDTTLRQYIDTEKTRTNKKVKYSGNKDEVNEDIFMGERIDESDSEDSSSNSFAYEE